MAAEQAEMTLRDYGAVIWNRKWIVVTPVIVATLLALVMSALQTPVYSASSQVLIEARGEDGVFGTNVFYLNARDLETEGQVVEGQAVRLRVQETLGLSDLPPEATASSVGETNVIGITVRDTNAENAAILANAYAVAYVDVRREQSVDQLLAAIDEVQTQINEIQAEIDTLDEEDARRAALVSQQASFNITLDQLRVDAALSTGGTTVIKTASVPSNPVEPTPVRTATLAAVVGLLIGLGAAFLIDYLDDKVRSASDLEDIGGVPVLAAVPIDPPPDHRPIAISEPTHDAVEEYRGLRTNLLFVGLDRPVEIIQVTSSLAGEGKTTTATNLAVVLARAGHKVAMVDADLRRPRIHEVFAVDMSPGLTDILLGTPPSEVVQHVPIDDETRISVYASGIVPSNPGEMLSGRRVADLLGQLKEHYDYVVVDSAPIVPVADSVALTAAVDTVLVVAHAGRVSHKDLNEAFDRLGQVSAPVVGAILNQSTEKRNVEYSYGGYRGYPARDMESPTAVPSTAPATKTPADTNGSTPISAPVDDVEGETSTTPTTT